jgi:transcriptional regulator with XRE-family HTH domain
VQAWLGDVELFDARAGQELAAPADLVAALFARFRGVERALILFEPLDALARAWGAATATRFYGRTCPALLERRAVAYWTLSTDPRLDALRDEVTRVAQVVVAVDDERLRIAKAEGRRTLGAGAVLTLERRDGALAAEPVPIATRVALALRAVRERTGMTKRELASLAGVSPSAITQAEEGRRGLSLRTVVQLAGGLGITVDDLLSGAPQPAYRLARASDQERPDEGLVEQLLADDAARLEAHRVAIPAGGAVEAGLGGQRGVLVVGQGLVQAQLAASSPVLRAGDAMLLEAAAPLVLRNLSDRPALAFWISTR